MNRTEQPISDESGFTEVFVKHGKLTENFDIERNWLFFHTAVSTGKIQRIFVDPAIKRLYCILFDKQGGQAQLTRGSDPVSLGEAGETLRRLRPYQNHDDHMHIRLYCPAGNTACVSQEEVLPGTGCQDLHVLEGRHASSWDSSNQQLRKEHDGW
jgi:penicillin-insensitive murein endopeptidase